MRRLFLFILTICLLCACDNTPNGVISKGKMEDILFDFHIAQSIIYDLNSAEQEEKGQEYIDAVFRKYDVTQEEFDSSLVWYSRHTKEYHKIYENIMERYEKLNSELQLLNGNKDMMAVFTNGGDTTDIWGAQKLLVLRNNDILNKESFSIKADTSFHKADTYILMCKTNLMLENRNDRSEFVTIGMAITYKDGTTVGSTRQATTNDKIQISIATKDSVTIDKVTGFFYFRGNNHYRSTAFVDDIKLIRMHQHPIASAPEPMTDTATIKVEEEEMNEVIQKDTIPHERISPNELLERNSLKKKTIDIKTAPEIRTPNTYGRRKAKRAVKN